MCDDYSQIKDVSPTLVAIQNDTRVSKVAGMHVIKKQIGGLLQNNSHIEQSHLNTCNNKTSMQVGAHWRGPCDLHGKVNIEYETLYYQKVNMV